MNDQWFYIILSSSYCIICCWFPSGVFWSERQWTAKGVSPALAKVKRRSSMTSSVLRLMGSQAGGGDGWDDSTSSNGRGWRILLCFSGTSRPQTTEWTDSLLMFNVSEDVESFDFSTWWIKLDRLWSIATDRLWSIANKRKDSQTTTLPS